MVEPGIPALGGLRRRRPPRQPGDLDLPQETDLEAYNLHLDANTSHEEEACARSTAATTPRCCVACNTPAAWPRVRSSSSAGRASRPPLPAAYAVALPDRSLLPLLKTAQRVVVVEASAGQLEDELRLALSHARVPLPPIQRVGVWGACCPRRPRSWPAPLRPDRPRGGLRMTAPSSTEQFTRHAHGEGLRARARTTARAAATAWSTSTWPRRSRSSASRTARSGFPRSAAACSCTTTSTSATPRPRMAAHPRWRSGQKIANPNSIVISYQGDGDLASIGTRRDRCRPRSSASRSASSS